LEFFLELFDLGFDLAAVLLGDFEGFDLAHAATFGVVTGLGGGGFDLVVIGAIVRAGILFDGCGTLSKVYEFWKIPRQDLEFDGDMVSGYTARGYIPALEGI
jgi:hypothetical protein